MSASAEWQKARRDACQSAATAWEAIRPLYESGSHVEEKADGPSTEADKLADRLLQEELQKIYPADEYGYLTEESSDRIERRDRRQVWIIDPIDGTKDFIKRNGAFAMHVGLVERGEDGLWFPVAAAVYRPHMGEMYSAVRGEGAQLEQYKQNKPTGEVRPLRVSDRDSLAELRAVASNSHRDEALALLLKHFAFAEIFHVGSIGIKLSLIAGGGYDVYLNPARGKCKEWDICAPELILTEAGGILTDFEGERRNYNQPNPVLPEGMVGSNGRAHKELLAEIAKLQEQLLAMAR